jgi:hypothetical protein
MHMLSNRLRVERQVQEGVEEVRAALYKLRRDPNSVSSVDPPVFAGLPAKEEAREIVHKRRQTLRKLGLSDTFDGSRHYENAEERDPVEKFVDNQERIVRRLSRGILLGDISHLKD